MLKTALRRTRTAAARLAPVPVRRLVWAAEARADRWAAARYGAWLRRRMHTLPRRSEQRLLHYTVTIDDSLSFYALYNDVFVHRIYHFEAQRPDPLILDCGSHIGGAILYFKHVYPKARIIGFEPDPVIFPYLEDNIRRNGLADVRLMHAALAAQPGTLPFYSDGQSGSCLATHAPTDLRERRRFDVPCVRLADYLTAPVDFLKMNIESAEWEVLSDASDCLRQVREIVIEYHHMPGLPRTLHKILTLLDSVGFEYILNDFDSGLVGVKTPFHLGPQSRYFLLVYARRRDAAPSEPEMIACGRDGYARECGPGKIPPVVPGHLVEYLGDE